MVTGVEGAGGALHRVMTAGAVTGGHLPGHGFLLMDEMLDPASTGAAIWPDFLLQLVCCFAGIKIFFATIPQFWVPFCWIQSSSLLPLSLVDFLHHLPLNFFAGTTFNFCWNQIYVLLKIEKMEVPSPDEFCYIKFWLEPLLISAGSSI